MSFYDDVIFPESISLYAFSGKRMRLTDISPQRGGFDQRNVGWSQGRRTYDAGMVARPASQWNLIDDFFEIVDGPAYGFLLKDPTDYKIAASQGMLMPIDGGVDAGTIGLGYGVPTYQAYKHLTVASRTKDRLIQKLKAGTIILLRNGVPVTAGIAAGNYSVDVTTGKFTFVADTTKSPSANSTKAITGISQANPGSVTCVGHGFVTGDKIKIISVGGMTQVNNLYFTITVVDADHFTIGVNTSAYTAYTSGGSAIKYGITQTNVVRINSAAHGFSNGDVVYLTGVVGTIEVNDLRFTVTAASANYFELSGIDGSAYTAYTSGGTISKFPQPTDTLTFSSEFYVPVRFVADELAWHTVSRSGSELLIDGPSVLLIEDRGPF
jgi:uncharacterized protein (TIGR02217 family)